MEHPHAPGNFSGVWASLTSGAVGTAVAGAFSYMTKKREREAAEKKIEFDRKVAADNITAAAEQAAKKIIADALIAKADRVDHGLWTLVEETRLHVAQELAAMTKRVDDLTAEVGRQRERANIAELQTGVANLRADDADKERAELKAKLSVALLEIESLHQQLYERDILDKGRAAELSTMHRQLTEAQRQLNKD